MMEFIKASVTVLVTVVSMLCLLSTLADARTYKDCHDMHKAGYRKAGIYKIYLNYTEGIKVFCNFTSTRGYTVIQRRQYGHVPFNQGMKAYVDGFGDQKTDFWLGLYNIYKLTSTATNQLQILMQDWSGNNRYAQYHYFALGDPQATAYSLHIAGFTGNVIDDLSYSNGMRFAAYDYTDPHNCAVHQKAGWWYNYCSYALLNGLYYKGGQYHPSSGYYDGIYWKDFNSLGYGYSLKFVQMQIAPASDL